MLNMKIYCSPESFNQMMSRGVVNSMHQGHKETEIGRDKSRLSFMYSAY